jgi:hypothetical protein
MNCLSEKKKLSICAKLETEEDKTKDVIIFAMESRTNSWNWRLFLLSGVPLTGCNEVQFFLCFLCM